MPRCRVNTSVVPGLLAEWIFWKMRGESLYVIYAYIFLDNIMTAFSASLSVNPEIIANLQTQF